PVYSDQALPAPVRVALVSDAKMTDRERLIAAMERSGWVQAKAARLLGLTPRQIGYALRKYGIEIKCL
ncbi:MAG: nif-specific transcriptional activator NifA, partial [Mesorhizobium sp.]